MRTYDAYHAQKVQQKNTVDEKNLQKGKQEDSVHISKEGLSALEESIASRTLRGRYFRYRVSKEEYGRMKEGIILKWAFRHF